MSHYTPALSHTWASEQDDMYWQPNTNPDSVAGMVQINRGDIPLYNLVVLICCTGVANGAWNSTSSAFGINYNPPTVSADKCVLAWTSCIGTGQDNQSAIPQWTQKFLSYLAQGYTVQSAEDRVYRAPTELIPGDNIKIRSDTGSVIRPIFAGDTLTKLKGAYESEDMTAPCFTITS